MKIALLGYGKMGRRIEELARERGHEVILKIGKAERASLTAEQLSRADVAIEFSVPSAAVDNIRLCFEAGVPIVAGTTGWQNDLKVISHECLDKKCTIFHSSNFSIGVNVLFAVNKFLASCMNRFPEYEVNLEEVHHTQKLDAPSGTATTLANDIRKILHKKTRWTTLKKNSSQKINEDEFPVYYERLDDVKGYHQVTYTSPIDQLKISHEAFNRDGFALGAILAAEFIKNKKGIYTTQDLFKFDTAD